MDIQLGNIYKSYQGNGSGQIIFEKMNASFPSGKRYVILGKSGVGKSSLLNLISGIDTPDQGTISIGNHIISDMDDTQRTIFRRKQIGFIYQFFNLIPVLTVLENITLISKLDGVPEKEYHKRALTLLESVELLNRQSDYPDKLSGGEQQRVAIARALVNDPQILLADEPTGNLDMETGVKVLELISDFALKHQKTLIMVTHSNDAVKYADGLFTVQSRKLLSQNSEQPAT